MYKIKQNPEDFIVEEVSDLEFDEKGQYTYFSLKKKQYNTEDAIHLLSKRFNIKRKDFSYAGTKDRNAITSQMCSVKGSISDFKTQDIEVRGIGKGDKPVLLGQLTKNRFTIVVRNIIKKPRNIDFIPNYFDDQRFGKNNLDIGISILKKDYKKTVSLIDNQETQDYIKLHPTDYVGAIRKVHLKILKLYINSVQSYIFNELLKKQIEKQTTFSIIKYKQGELYFPKNMINLEEIQLISFDSDVTDETKSLLEELKINKQDFIIRSMPFLTPHGSTRKAFVTVNNLKIDELEEDELNKSKKKVKVSFELDKGSYATIVVKGMFKE